jgi:hypothetical protein
MYFLVPTAGGLGKLEVNDGSRLYLNFWRWSGCSVVMFIRPTNILANRNDIFNVGLIITTSAIHDG